MKTHKIGLSYVDVAEKAQVQMTYGDIIIDSAVLFNVKKRNICSNMVWKLETHEYASQDNENGCLRVENVDDMFHKHKYVYNTRKRYVCITTLNNHLSLECNASSNEPWHSPSSCTRGRNQICLLFNKSQNMYTYLS